MERLEREEAREPEERGALSSSSLIEKKHATISAAERALSENVRRTSKQLDRKSLSRMSQRKMVNVRTKATSDRIYSEEAMVTYEELDPSKTLTAEVLGWTGKKEYAHGEGIKRLQEERSQEAEKGRERFQEEYERMKSETENQTKRVASVCRNKLKELEREAERRISSLEGEDETLRKVEEPAMRRLLDAVKGQKWARHAAIDKLESELEMVISNFVSSIGKELDTLADALLLRAQMPRGQAEREIEDIARRLNEETLGMRREASNCIGELRKGEIRKVARWKARWSRSLDRWRSVRARATELQYAERIRELKEPEPITRMLENQRSEELRKKAQAESHFATFVRSNIPPSAAITENAAKEWSSKAKRMAHQWRESADNFVARLTVQEDEVSSEAHSLLESLRRELKCLHREEEGTAVQAVEERDSDGRDLVERESEALKQRTSGWVAALEQAADFAERIGVAADAGQAKVEQAKADADRRLENKNNEHKENWNQLEMKVQTAVSHIRSASDEKEVDEHVQTAINSLRELEAEARKFHAESLSQLSQRVEDVKTACDGKIDSLCESMGIRWLREGEMEEERQAQADGKEEKEEAQKGAGGHSGKEGAWNGKGGTDEAEPVQKEAREVRTSDGHVFTELQDETSSLEPGCGKEQVDNMVMQARSQVIREELNNRKRNAVSEESLRDARAEEKHRQLELSIQSLRPQYGKIEEGDASERRTELEALRRKASGALKQVRKVRQRASDVATSEKKRQEAERIAPAIANVERALTRVQSAPSEQSLDVVGRDAANQRDKALEVLDNVTSRLKEVANEGVTWVERELYAAEHKGGLSGSEKCVEENRQAAYEELEGAKADRDAFSAKVDSFAEEKAQKIRSAYTAAEEALEPHRADLRVATEIANAKSKVKRAVDATIEHSKHELERLERAVSTLEGMLSGQAGASSSSKAPSATSVAVSIEEAQRLLRERSAAYKCLANDAVPLTKRKSEADFVASDSTGSTHDDKDGQPSGKHSKSEGDNGKEPETVVEAAEAVAREAKDAFASVSKEHYAQPSGKQQQPPERQAVRPNEVPATAKEVEEHGEQAAADARREAQEHAEHAGKRCYAIAVRLDKCLPSVIGEAFRLLAAERSDAVHRGASDALEAFEARFKRSRQTRMELSDRLKPSLRRESRQEEVDGIESKEDERRLRAEEEIAHLEKTGREEVRSSLLQSRVAMNVFGQRLMEVVDAVVSPSEVSEWAREASALDGMRHDRLRELRKRYKESGSIAGAGMTDEEAGVQRETGRDSVKRSWKSMPLASLSFLEADEGGGQDQEGSKRAGKSHGQREKQSKEKKASQKEKRQESNEEGSLRGLDRPAERALADDAHEAVNLVAGAGKEAHNRITNRVAQCRQEEGEWQEGWRRAVAFLRSERDDKDDQ